MHTERLRNLLLRFINRPTTGFTCYLLVMASIIFMPREGPILMLFYLVLPWMVCLVIALNKAFISRVFRKFTLSDAIKRNHALEHGTIFFLHKRYGTQARIGGSAYANGFRIFGVPQASQIVTAFETLLKELKRGHSEFIISMRCGTNIATAQGLGIVLLTVTTGILLLSGAGLIISLLALSGNVLLYLLLRTRLANWVQNRFFMSLDFTNARIQSIYRVEKKFYFWEKNPIFFVKTIVS